ncbi:TlpA disulfide reductase family protein [Flavivirga eckloniae]|uniref:Thioredoxin n=1 Tax=Flavivirga eckloniae TaxID=1803846 RepID=A0A2K9PPF8_9FLAO|nr:TlpA disulfide reductase family protein [Flavivirga eckloniae]AUP78925.1 thioredoxin [Flavivirga eckloniae]
MKHTIWLIAIVLFTSCNKQAPKDYVTLSGTFKNIDFDKLILRKYTSKGDSITTINFNPDGTFSDTLKLEEGEYFFSQQGKDPLAILLYLKNGDDITINYDVKGNESAIFEGTGIQGSIYMEARRKKVKELIPDEEKFIATDSITFYKKIEGLKNEIRKLVDENKNLGTAFIELQEEFIEFTEGTMVYLYNMNKAKNDLIGKPAPNFVNYENHAGGLTSLEDLKGKYVYIDLWATWCGPCKKEFPALKELEKSYHGKNIQFVGISVDGPSNYDPWRALVTEEELTGIQLLAPENHTIYPDYAIQAIPRFIILDPQGNVVDPDAPRPSSNEIKPLLDKLLK